jgi:hypothetical protein
VVKARWRYRYDYQAASWVVYGGGKRLADFYPSRRAAEVAVAHLNSGGSVMTIPDPPEWYGDQGEEIPEQDP